MNMPGPVLDAPHKGHERGSAVIEKLLQSWVVLCEDYRQRERCELIERKATETKVDEFRQELKWLLRSAKLLHSLATDPEYPARQYAEDIAWRLCQLEDSWKMLESA